MSEIRRCLEAAQAMLRELTAHNSKMNESTAMLEGMSPPMIRLTATLFRAQQLPFRLLVPVMREFENKVIKIRVPSYPEEEFTQAELEELDRICEHVTIHAQELLECVLRPPAANGGEDLRVKIVNVELRACRAGAYILGSLYDMLSMWREHATHVIETFEE